MNDDAEIGPTVVGVELGGTKAIAVLARGDRILDRLRVPTTEPGSTLGALVERVTGWFAADRAPEAIGIGSFGPVGLDPGRDDYGHVTTTPKAGWSDVDVVGPFSGFGVPVAFETDVAAAALAEGRWGASRGCTDHVYITIGTGVGVGIVAGGRPVHGLVHPEAGHLRVRRRGDDTFSGTCPYHGDCIEGLASGPAIAARTGTPAEELAPDHPVWRDVVAELGELVTSLTLTVSPQRIVLGGGVGAGRADLVEGIRDAVARNLAGYVAGLDDDGIAGLVRPAALGHDAGPLGTVAVAQSAAHVPSASPGVSVAVTPQPWESRG